MIVGSGLLARAFAPEYAQRDDMCIYAAGVSNSGCTDTLEFIREMDRLQSELNQKAHEAVFVYFGTCSVLDPELPNTAYVRHKLSMEKMVLDHSGGVVIRLPQVAGRTPNPHTLLNYLFDRIYRSETFNLWINAKRNIIDVDDVVSIAKQLIEDGKTRNTVLNIANPIKYSMSEIISVMEDVIGKRAVFKEFDRGSEYSIDISTMQAVLCNTGVKFTDDYLYKVVSKYYSSAYK